MNSYPVELLTCAETAEADRLAIAAGTPGIVLMERAGAAIADASRQILVSTGGKAVAVLCGPGNNGGDGFVAARLLRQMGYGVSAGLLGVPGQLTGDAALAAAAWTGKTGSAALLDLGGADLVIDALFGAGLSRDLDGRARAIVERLNAWRASTGKPVLAVDVPSGLDGDTGAVRGVAVTADTTVTFFRLKPGHVLLPGRQLCGGIVLADIGIAPAVLESIAPRRVSNAPAAWRAQLPIPAASGHKYTRGHVLAVSGPAHQTGAARLSARGALRAGAGLVTVAAEGAAIAVNAAHLTAIMLAPFEGLAGLSAILDDNRKNAVVIGPGAGVGEATVARAEAILRHPGRPATVLDADALTSFAGQAQRLAALVQGAQRAVILTPHEGEFARLFKGQELFVEFDSEHEVRASGQSDWMSEQPSRSRISRAIAAARFSGAILCLKGPDTIVAAPDGRLAIMGEATPWLATAGSGDVLAGMIAGLLAQGMPAFEACAAAVWMHAQAAGRFGPGLIAEDIAEQLPAVWKELAVAPGRTGA